MCQGFAILCNVRTHAEMIVMGGADFGPIGPRARRARRTRETHRRECALPGHEASYRRARRARATQVDRLPLGDRRARSIVARHHGEAAAAAAVEEYERKARGGEPDSMPELELAAGATLVDVLVASGLAPSRTRATNDLKNNAIAVDGVRTKDNLVLAVGAHVVRSGKNRFARVTIT